MTVEYQTLIHKMAIMEFLEKKCMKKINNSILLNIGFPCGCCLFPKSITKRKLLLNNFKLLKLKKPKKPIKNLHTSSIYKFGLSVCLFVCLYPINVKTDEPIGPKFFVGHHVTTGKV